MLSGHVELDEVLCGGRVSGMGGGRGAPNKTVVFALAERGGRIRRQYRAERLRPLSIRPIVLENVERGSTISTDELRSYGLLTK